MVWNLNLDQIESNTGRVLHKHRVKSESVGSSTHPFLADTVLYSKLRPYLNKVVLADEAGIATTELVSVRCNPEKLLPKYISYFLRSPEFLSFANTVVAGAKMPRMVMSEFWKYEVPTPPLDEQHRIAAILDQVDYLQSKRQEAIKQLDILIESVFINMFGDPGINPMDWPEMQLGEIILGKPNNGIFKKNESYGKGLPVVWVEELFIGSSINVAESRALQPSEREIEQYGLRHGDILFCRSSLKLEGIGYNNVYLGEDNKALFECHVIRISPDQDKICPTFLNFLLRMPNQRLKLFKYAKTVTMSTIDQEGLQKITLPVPPLEMQISFVKKLSVIQSIRSVHLSSSKELDALFASIQHLAFRGKL
jgi:type I restriction enzyme S subunit